MFGGNSSHPDAEAELEKLRQQYGSTTSNANTTIGSSDPWSIEDDTESATNKIEEPTHECMWCETERRIESAPTEEWQWCDSCEDVTRHVVLEDED